MKILLVIFYDCLVDDCIFKLGWELCSLEQLKYETLQEIFLFSEVFIILCIRNLERIHRDWLFLGVADVRSIKIAAKSFVTVTSINNDYIGVLLTILTHNSIHKK